MNGLNGHSTEQMDTSERSHLKHVAVACLRRIVS